MMNNWFVFKYCLYFLLPGILFSCVSSKELNRVSPEQFAPFSTENFNGKYNNCTDSAAFSLLDVLENKSLLFAEKSSDCQAAILELYFDGRHMLHIKQILDEKVVFFGLPGAGQRDGGKARFVALKDLPVLGAA